MVFHEEYLYDRGSCVYSESGVEKYLLATRGSLLGSYLDPPERVCQLFDRAMSRAASVVIEEFKRAFGSEPLL
jgi:hypothetical protein